MVKAMQRSRTFKHPRYGWSAAWLYPRRKTTKGAYLVRLDSHTRKMPLRAKPKRSRSRRRRR